MPERGNLKRFGGYLKARELFDPVVADLSPLTKDQALHRLISQQLASADSIASNMEEGHGRGSKRDYVHFLVIARGPAQETAGRYGRFQHWRPAAIVARCDEIVGILAATIKTPGENNPQRP
ncbi:MAG: four helix bundle protein [Opitutaceae bacterium]|jgi:four helix bundle protein